MAYLHSNIINIIFAITTIYFHHRHHHHHVHHKGNNNTILTLLVCFVFSRDLMTTIQWSVQDNCSVMLKESLPSGMYVDLDQVNMMSHELGYKVNILLSSLLLYQQQQQYLYYHK